MALLHAVRLFGEGCLEMIIESMEKTPTRGVVSVHFSDFA